MHVTGGPKGQITTIDFLAGVICQDSKLYIEIKGAEVCHAIGGQASRDLFRDSKGEFVS